MALRLRDAGPLCALRASVFILFDSSQRTMKLKVSFTEWTAGIYEETRKPGKGKDEDDDAKLDAD